MAKHIITFDWIKDLEFHAAQEESRINLSPTNEPGSGGFSPKQLLLTSLGGCTAMDVVSLLPKMRVPFNSFRVEVSGILADDHPKVYTHIHISYILSVSDEYRPQVEMAISKSLEKYCGVYAMLSKVASISHDIVLNN